MSDQALVLYNKVWANIRTLQSLNQSRHRLCHQMAEMQRSMQGTIAPNRKPRLLTLYEAALLRDSEKLERHQQSLLAAAGLVVECKEARRNAHTFFGWVEDLHQGWQQAGYLQQVT